MCLPAEGLGTHNMLAHARASRSGISCFVREVATLDAVTRRRTARDRKTASCLSSDIREPRPKPRSSIIYQNYLHLETILSQITAAIEQAKMSSNKPLLAINS